MDPGNETPGLRDLLRSCENSHLIEICCALVADFKVLNFYKILTHNTHTYIYIYILTRTANNVAYRLPIAASVQLSPPHSHINVTLHRIPIIGAP